MDSRPLKKVRGLKVIWVSKLASIRSSTSSLFFLSLIYQSFIGLKGASWTTRSLLELELLVAPLNPPLCCRHNVHLYIFFSMLYRWILVQHQEICVIACRVMIEYRARILIVWSYLASKSIKNKFNLWPKINIWGGESWDSTTRTSPILFFPWSRFFREHDFTCLFIKKKAERTAYTIQLRENP
jgi:hypothetical protein